MKFTFMVLLAAVGTYFGTVALLSAARAPSSNAQAFGKTKTKVAPKGLSPRGLNLTQSAPTAVPPTEVATFAAGCFWGVEDQFRKQDGVIATSVGFMGGKSIPGLTYERVCEGDTGHAEVVQVEYDPKKISYETLLALFWDIHDPTTKNRQGPDVGDQYRSAIFFHSEEQKKSALASEGKLKASGELSAPIVTEVAAAGEFVKADDHHQQYVEKGGYAVCHLRKNRKH